MTDKVLLIDDEPEFLEVMSERMGARDVDVTTADSASVGLELAEKKSFDAIVLDLKMPGMDGLEALQALRRKRPELQIILLTGHASVEKGIEAMKLGAMDFLEKPADLDALMDKIHKAKAKKMILVEDKNRQEIKEILMGKGW